MTIVTQTDHPKSVHNRCVIEVFGGVFVLSCCFLDFSVGVGAFVICHRTESDLFLFLSCFSHSDCGSPPVKTYANKRTLLEEK